MLWPAIRVGYFVAPAPIAERVRRMKFNCNMVTSAEALAKVEQFLLLDNGELLRGRIELLRTTYKARYTALASSLSQLDVSWSEPQGGMFVYITAPKDVDFAALVPKLLKHGLVFVPGIFCYADQASAPRNTARINFASTPENLSPLVGQRLAKVLQ